MRELAGDCANILDIQDIGSVAVNDIDSIPYYVMRFQTGGALRDWTAPGDGEGNPIFTRETMNWVTGVATALDFLHHQEEAVFHRDVKPENILFDASGTPKLSDFGIVKNIKKATTNITQTGAAMGTVAYMPPEIWRGGKFSPASDQFSFAATVYEMISGKRPYDGETPFAMLEALAKGHDKLADTIGLPAGASAALDRGLAHEPDKRFETCRDLAKAFLSGLSNRSKATGGNPSDSSEGKTKIHVGPVEGKIGGGKHVDSPPPQPGASPGKGGLFENAGGRVVPKKPESPQTGSNIPSLIGVAALLLALVGGGLFVSGAFSGGDNQPTAVRPDSPNQPQGVSPGSSLATTSASSATELEWFEYKEAPLSLVEEHAALGFAGAETELGFRASKKGDDATALKWYRKAEKKNYLRALCNIGVFYEHGKVVAKDENKAFSYYQRAIEADPSYANAQYNLGVCYDKGKGVKEDDVEAVKWYRKAAEQDYASAQYNLGLMYENGEGVKEDDVEAVKWYRKAAEQDHGSAQFNLGVIYDNGQGVKEDDVEAVKWYRKAAEQDHASAQYNLGVRYANGRGVQKDDVEAVKWYRKAAEQDHASAQYNLGLMYLDGEGVRKNTSEAKRWFKKAADQGHEKAKAHLRKLN